MKQVVLAAGKGTRLRPLTADDPKPLVRVSGEESIFELTLRGTEAAGTIEETIVVVGYEADAFRSAISALEGGLAISAVENERYDSAGPLHSLSIGVEAAGEDAFVVQNGDTVYASGALRAVTEPEAAGIRMAVSPTTAFEPDDMRLASEEGALTEVGKTIAAEPTAISAGLVAVRGAEYRRAFAEATRSLLERDEDACWHEVLNELTARGIDVELVEVDADTWWEVDTVPDLERVRSIYG